MNQQVTKIEPITDAVIDDFLDNPDAESVIIPASTPAPVTPAAAGDTAAQAAAAKIAADKAAADAAALAAAQKVPLSEAEDILNNLDNEEEEEEEEEGAPAATKKTKKAASPVMATAINRLIEKKILQPFEGEDNALESDKDIEELILANVDKIREDARVEASTEIYDSVPEDVQHLLRYVANGGKDTRAIMKSLLSSAATQQLDMSTPEGQEQAIREFWGMTDYGTPEEIEEELNTLKDMPGALEKKATQLKPRLDAKRKETIDADLKRQEEYRGKREEAANAYRNNVFNALSAGTLGPIKINAKIQNMLHEGLVEAKYPTLNNQKTNLFGHLLEKYQYVEPNPALIAEALWLFQDPEGYRAALKGLGAAAEVAETVKVLKSASAQRNAGASPAASGERTSSGKGTGEGLKRPKPNIFART